MGNVAKQCKPLSYWQIHWTNQRSTNAPSPTQIKVTKIKIGMKLKAKTTEETAQQILGKQLVNISEDATESLPLIATMRHNIQKAQKRWKHSPDSTKFWGYLCTSKRVPTHNIWGAMADSDEGDPERISIICLLQISAYLLQSEHWFYDETFRICPKVFFKVYTVHAQRRGVIFPLSFGLLSNKSEATYIRFYRKVFKPVFW